MDRHVIRIVLFIVGGIFLISWLFLQYKYVSFDRELFQIVSDYVKQQDTPGDPLNKGKLASIELEKIRNDFNFNFITAFLSTVILSIGIILFIQINTQQKQLEDSIVDLKRKLEEQKGVLNDIEVKFRILNRCVSEQPLDLLYALVRIHLLSTLWEKENRDDRYIMEIRNALQHILQIAGGSSKLSLGVYEFLKICETLPDNSKYDSHKSRIKEELGKKLRGTYS